jgi:DNA-binding response OmpR family regulator
MGTTGMARILVIEDEELARWTIRDILEAEGYQVAEAADGEEGLALQKARPADLVVTDIIMPNKDGVATIIEMRKAFPTLPIIAVSGGGRTKNLDFLRFAEEFGANRVLVKPFPAEALVAAIRTCLAGRR